MCVLWVDFLASTGRAFNLSGLWDGEQGRRFRTRVRARSKLGSVRGSRTAFKSRLGNQMLR